MGKPRVTNHQPKKNIMPNSTYTDGALQYGSAILTITPKTSASPSRSQTATFDAVADSEFSFDVNSKEVDQTDQNGEYAGGFGIPEKRKGSCTIQLPAARRAYAGDSFVVDITSNDFIQAGVTDFQIVNASQPYEKEGYRKQSISYFIRKYTVANNAVVNDPAAA
jgi:hypothetical protein